MSSASFSSITLSFHDFFKKFSWSKVILFIQFCNFADLILSFDLYSFVNNPATLGIKAEQIAEGTPMVNPNPVEHGDVPTANPITPVKISKDVIFIIFLLV